MGATAAPAGQSEIVIFGGDRGDLFSDLEAADLSIAEVKAKQAKSSQMPGPAVAAFVELKLAEKKWIYQKHPGFARELLAFDTWRNTWRITATAPLEVPVTTVAVRHGGAILIPSGEIKPGIRTPDVLRVRPVVK
jgi:N-acetylneuraminic acid mutarotase